MIFLSLNDIYLLKQLWTDNRFMYIRNRADSRSPNKAHSFMYWSYPVADVIATARPMHLECPLILANNYWHILLCVVIYREYVYDDNTLLNPFVRRGIKSLRRRWRVVQKIIVLQFRLFKIVTPTLRDFWHVRSTWQ